MASGGFATYLTNQAIPELFIHSTIHLTYSMTTNIIYHYELLTLPNYVYSLVIGPNKDFSYMHGEAPFGLSFLYRLKSKCQCLSVCAY